MTSHSDMSRYEWRVGKKGKVSLEKVDHVKNPSYNIPWDDSVRMKVFDEVRHYYRLRMANLLEKSKKGKWKRDRHQ